MNVVKWLRVGPILVDVIDLKTDIGRYAEAELFVIESRGGLAELTNLVDVAISLRR